MLVSALEGHRLWAPSYDSAPNPILALEGRRLPEILGAVEHRRAVDIACGTGRWAAHLASRGAIVVGVDFCSEMLLRAPVSISGRLALGNAEALPIASGAADVVVCSFALGYFEDPARVFREMARISAPGARVVVSDIHPEAIARGWTRSFRAESGRYEVEHYAHSLSAVHEAAAAAGLDLVAEDHLRFGAPERAIFERAGKIADFDACADVPAVCIGEWRRRWC